MLDFSLVRTANDYYHAALVFQHGGNSEAYSMAVNLIKMSIRLDSTSSRKKWLFAAATDRYLLNIGKPHIYGTQYGQTSDDPVWRLREIEASQISDATRIEYGVETLAEQKEREKNMNKKSFQNFIPKE